MTSLRSCRYTESLLDSFCTKGTRSIETFRFTSGSAAWQRNVLRLPGQNITPLFLYDKILLLISKSRNRRHQFIHNNGEVCRVLPMLAARFLISIDIFICMNLMASEATKCLFILSL
jgi:hypothetical protein